MNNLLKRKLYYRLFLIKVLIAIGFCLIIFPISIYSNLDIYLNKNDYKIGKLYVKDIFSDRYGGPYLYAEGSVNNINTTVFLGLERDIKIQDYFTIFYKPNGKYSFLITKDFKFNPTQYLIYAILEIISIPVFLLIIFKIYKYFKNDKIDI